MHIYIYTRMYMYIYMLCINLLEYIYIYMNVYLHIYVYVYIMYRGQEKWDLLICLICVVFKGFALLCMHVGVYKVYVVFICMYVYMYVYIKRGQEACDLCDVGHLQRLCRVELASWCASGRVCGLLMCVNVCCICMYVCMYIERTNGIWCAWRGVYSKALRWCSQR